jgi:prolyl-tRNA synthetase
VHNLGQTFAKTFDITYETAEGEHEYVYQTCYGVSDRVIASIIGIHGDEKGLCLPSAVAPYQIVIIPIIFKKGAEEVLAYCKKMANNLKKAGLRVHFDDRDIRAGKKYYEYEMRGIPVRMEIGPRDIKNKNAVVFRRDKMEKESISLDSDNFIDEIKALLNDINHNMKNKAWESFNKHIRFAKTVEDAAAKIEEYKGIVTFQWCGDESCGKELEEKVRVDILGIQDENATPGECINCGKPASCNTLISKTY